MMRTGIVIVLMICAEATSVRSQPVSAPLQSPTPERQAGLYADSASIALKSGDFDTAIDLFIKAYKIVPIPEYLFDIAQANRKKAEALRASDPMKAAEFRDAAREYYQRFLDTHPKDEDLELKARGLKARLDEEWALEHPKEEAERRAEEERKREAMTRAEQARLAEERHKQSEHEAQIQAAVQRTVKENNQNKARVLKLSGGTAVGAGMLSAGVGIYLGLKARHLAEDITRQDVFDRSRISQGDQEQREMVIAYIASGVLVAGGTFTFWLGHRVTERAAAEGTVSVTAVPMPQGGSLVMLGSF